MGRIKRTVCILLCALVACFALTACASGGAPSHDVSTTYVIPVEKLEEKLDGFLDGREDRTTYTDAELAAAEYLRDELARLGYDDASVDGFTVIESEKVSYDGRNVTATYRSSARDARNVIIGAYYDNNYSASYNGKVSGTRSHGALSNGTGVATLLAVAEYLATEKPELGFDVSIVFFGAGASSDIGAVKYYESMKPADLAKTVLMVELSRIGAENLYAFSDARTTKREALFDRVAQENKLAVYKPSQKSPLMTELYALQGVPYYQWTQSGVFPVFFNNGIPTLNLIGGSWETIDITDREFSEHGNVTMTERDTLAELRAINPDYARNMAAASTLILKSFADPAFVETAIYDKANFPDTDVLMMRWIWYLVVLGVVGIAYAAMTLVNKRLADKYPFKPAPPPRNIRMAVFGMDYEDKNSDSIFVDIKRAPPEEDIFPGVPNNSGSDPFDSDRNGGSK